MHGGKNEEKNTHTNTRREKSMNGKIKVECIELQKDSQRIFKERMESGKRKRWNVHVGSTKISSPSLKYARNGMKTCLNYNVISWFYSLTEFLYPLSLSPCSFSM